VSRRLAAGVPLTGSAGDALAAAIVKQVDVDVWTVRLPDQLDRASWEQVAAALGRIAGGGRYQNGAQVHRFDRDPTAELAAVLDTGVLPQDAKRREGWVRTPEDVADNFAVNYALLELETLAHDGPMRVLEPSAGEGALADAMVKFHVEIEQVTCVEADPWRAAVLRAKGYRTDTARFEEWAFARQNGPFFDAVVMNPPFSAPDDPLVWATHVLLAWPLVDRGGCLTAIVPRSYESHEARRVQDIRVLVDRYGHCYDHFDNFHFDKDAFRQSGFGGQPVIIHLRRPLWLPPAPQPIHAGTAASRPVGAGQSALF
jgi:hypothetical protein